ncbi:hypothetical protein K435DRAFT_780303, partial [Dendrothele bispora CBS 962.96]
MQELMKCIKQDLTRPDVGAGTTSSKNDGQGQRIVMHRSSWRKSTRPKLPSSSDDDTQSDSDTPNGPESSPNNRVPVDKVNDMDRYTNPRFVPPDPRRVDLAQGLPPFPPNAFRMLYLARHAKENAAQKTHSSTTQIGTLMIPSRYRLPHVTKLAVGMGNLPQV